MARTCCRRAGNGLHCRPTTRCRSCSRRSTPRRVLRMDPRTDRCGRWIRRSTRSRRSTAAPKGHIARTCHQRSGTSCLNRHCPWDNTATLSRHTSRSGLARRQGRSRCRLSRRSTVHAPRRTFDRCDCYKRASRCRSCPHSTGHHCRRSPDRCTRSKLARRRSRRS
jgi:hypothetical protein